MTDETEQIYRRVDPGDLQRRRSCPEGRRPVPGEAALDEVSALVLAERAVSGQAIMESRSISSGKWDHLDRLFLHDHSDLRVVTAEC